MKLYTDKTQTHRIMELRGETEKDVKPYVRMFGYNVGDLISFCQDTTKYHTLLYQQTPTGWIASIRDTVYNFYDKQLIDAMFNLYVKIKTDGLYEKDRRFSIYTNH